MGVAYTCALRGVGPVDVVDVEGASDWKPEKAVYVPLQVVIRVEQEWGGGLSGSAGLLFDVGGQVGGDVRSCETGSGWKRSDMRPFLPVPWRGNKLSAFLTSSPLNVLNILDSI